MSHYSVLVCTDDCTTVSSLLEDFDENKVVEEYILYTKEEFIRRERESLQRFYDTTYSEYLKDKNGYREKHKDHSGHLEYVSKTFPKLYNMSDEELYKDSVKSYDYSVDMDGNILSTYNPQSKWDWYVEGGRFSGLLRKKDTGDFVDSEYAQNVDFSMNDEVYSNALRFWEVCVDGEEPKNDEEKEFYTIFKKEYYINKYGTKENYAKRQATFSTWVVLTPDGTWYEPGQMGWFGCSSASDEDEDKFFGEYEKFIQMAIENNWFLTVVDCHI